MWAPKSGERWVDGQHYDGWVAVYDGYGYTTSSFFGGVETIAFEPNAAQSNELTHASLAVTEATFDDLDLTASIKTEQQLRSPIPNPWEVGWLLWRYTDPDHFYALALKPNGWELTKQDPAYPGKQRFLATGNSPTFVVGSWHDVRVTARANTFEAYVDGSLITRFTDDEGPYPTGSVGLYTEDARVLFRNVVAAPPGR